MKHTNGWFALPCIAILGTVVLTGCGNGNESPASAAPAGQGGSGTVRQAGSGPAVDPKAVAYENAIADCMKQQGFTYVPHPEAPGAGPGDPESQNVGRASLLRADADVRAWRQKYGLGQWSKLVYPNDPALTRQVRSATDPNDAIVEALDPAQRGAYNVARFGTADRSGYDPKTMHGALGEKRKRAVDGSCEGKAYSIRFQDSASKREQWSKSENAEAERLNRKFQNDPDVIAAAKKYADCLRGRGYKIRDDAPEGVEGAYATQDAVPFPWNPPGPNEQVSKTKAKHELIAEIKVAVDDVDCRGSYAEIVRTTYAKVIHNFFDEKGDAGVG